MLCLDLFIKFAEVVNAENAPRVRKLSRLLLRAEEGEAVEHAQDGPHRDERKHHRGLGGVGELEGRRAGAGEARESRNPNNLYFCNSKTNILLKSSRVPRNPAKTGTSRLHAFLDFLIFR